MTTIAVFKGKKYQVEMPDGSVWQVPVSLIAQDHAEYYAKVDNVDFDVSLRENTIPMFEDEYEIRDWATNNMDWDDVKHMARQVKAPNDSVDYQEGWMNGDYELV
jgi:hypothetical protein